MLQCFPLLGLPSLVPRSFANIFPIPNVLILDQDDPKRLTYMSVPTSWTLTEGQASPYPHSISSIPRSSSVRRINSRWPRATINPSTASHRSTVFTTCHVSLVSTPIKMGKNNPTLTKPIQEHRNSTTIQYMRASIQHTSNDIAL